MDEILELLTPDKLGHTTENSFDSFMYGLLLLPLDLFQGNICIETQKSIIEEQKRVSQPSLFWPLLAVRPAVFNDTRIDYVLEFLWDNYVHDVQTPVREVCCFASRVGTSSTALSLHMAAGIPARSDGSFKWA